MDVSTTEPINLRDDRIRFLCEVEDRTYKLYMGNNMIRTFTDETLPDQIKSLLGMINAFDWDKINGVYDDPTHMLWGAASYYPPIANEIGWRIKHRYALVVPYKYFLTLRGEVES